MNRTVIRVLNKLGLLQQFNVAGSLVINKKRFQIPIIQNLGYDNLFMSEPWMLEVLKIVFSIDKGKFVDVGVNIGQTLLKVKSVVPDIPYIGFEPNPVCVYYSGKLVKVNRIADVKIYPLAISSSSGIGELNYYYDSDTDSAASVVTNFRLDQKIVRSEFIVKSSLDAIKDFIDLQDLSVLKIDVEGAEFEVITAFRDEISAWKPIILMEILPAYSSANTDRISNQNSIVQILRELDYSMFRIKKSDGNLKDLNEITDIEIHSDLDACDYVMVPAAKRVRFIDAYRNALQREFGS